MAMRPFIRAAELWIPSPDGIELVSGGGLYGDMEEFAALSGMMRFRLGEGLPGEAWRDRRPVVMKDLSTSRFRRIEAAAAAGLTSGVALPIFAGDDIRAVVVLFCGGDHDHVGAIELWLNDPDESPQMGLADGFYGGAELFELTSRMTKFGRGFGLPGAVWASGMPVVMRDLYRSDRFLRRDEAQKAGLTMGVGLPFDYDPGRAWVMAFLSALGTPIARQFEIWTPDASGEWLIYDTGVFESAGAEMRAPRPTAIAAGDRFVGRAFGERLPVLSGDCAADAPWLVAAEEDGEHDGAVAIPILDAAGALKAVTAWRF